MMQKKPPQQPRAGGSYTKNMNMGEQVQMTHATPLKTKEAEK